MHADIRTSVQLQLLPTTTFSCLVSHLPVGIEKGHRYGEGLEACHNLTDCLDIIMLLSSTVSRRRVIDSTEVVCVRIQCSGCYMYSKELTCAFSVTSAVAFDLLITGRIASGFR